MKFNITQKEIENHISGVLTSYFGVKAEDASKAQIYRATCMVIRDLLTSERVNFKKECRAQNAKQVYYMSMEFLAREIPSQPSFQHGYHRRGDESG